MEKLIELFDQIRELAGVGSDALKEALSKQGGGEGKPPAGEGGPPQERGGPPPGAGGPPRGEGGPPSEEKPPEEG